MHLRAFVIGAGAIGASTALHLARGGAEVIVLEKEAGPALHQSGRNSGVIHAGYNLKPGSKKAKFCIDGARQLKEYCRTRGIAVQEGGILVVARNEPEVAVLEELQRRAKGNQVAAEILDVEGLRRHEPYAAGVAALRAAEGASFDARAYVHALTSDALREGARILYDTRVLGIRDPTLRADGEIDPHARGSVQLVTSKGVLDGDLVVNAAGLFVDRLAGPLAPDMRVVPFRGYYAEITPARTHLVRSHIYAAPDLNFPFLGVHLSRRADGRVIVGPGAMLAFGREAYRLFEFSLRDLWTTFGWQGFWRMLIRPEFRSLIRSELAKSLRLRAIWSEARLLVPELRPGDLVRSYAGNRAQMVDRTGQLVEDLVVRETGRAVHVLNAVSPGLTCSLAFGAHLADRALALPGTG